MDDASGIVDILFICETFLALVIFTLDDRWLREEDAMKDHVQVIEMTPQNIEFHVLYIGSIPVTALG